MSNPEKYCQLSSEYHIYYLESVANRFKWVCLEGYSEHHLFDPQEALALLAWLEQERTTLEQMAKGMGS